MFGSYMEKLKDVNLPFQPIRGSLSNKRPLDQPWHSIPAIMDETRQPSCQQPELEGRSLIEPPSGHDFSKIRVKPGVESHVAYPAGDQLNGDEEEEPIESISTEGPTGAEGAAGQVATAGTETPSGGLPPIKAMPAKAPPAKVAPAKPAACPHPVNWVHGPNAADEGPDGIGIDITWESSTGKLADLGHCEVREHVSYDPIPNPPFLWNPPNPTILKVAANLGAGHDTHSYPPGLKTGITNPREEGTMIAHQVYQWKCTGEGCTGNWTDFPGQTYELKREVFQRFVYVNPWRYRITKRGTGAGNAFKYSREVEIPEP